MTPDHERLLEDMSQYLHSAGYRTMSATYADVCDAESKRLLSKMYSVPATYVRTRSDRIAFNPQTETIFEFDAKTNLTKHEDVFIELIPVVAHYVISNLFGLKTIYGFRWPNIDREDIGFEINDTFAEMVTAIFIFDRDCQVEVNQWVEHGATSIFKNAKIVKCNRGRGSGDPAIKMEPEALQGLPHWKHLFNAITECD